MSVKDEGSGTAYDYFTPDIVKKIERSIKHAVGAKSEAVITEYGDPRSIFVFTPDGLKCSNCGAVQAGSDPQACGECGASHVLTLIVGYR